MAHVDQSQSKSKWCVRLSILAMLCSFPVVIAIVVTFLANVTGLNDDVNFALIQGMILLLGTVIATLVCIPALILGIAGLCMERRAFTWIAFLFSLVPAGLMAFEAYSLYEYEATKDELAAQTYRVNHSHEEFKRNPDGSVQRVSGGSGGGSIRSDGDRIQPQQDDPVPPTDGRFHYIPRSLLNGRVTYRIYFPNGLTSDIDLVLGEQQETWDPTNQYGVRLTIDELGDKKATTERLLKQAKDDHRDPIDVLVEALSSQDIQVAEDAASQLKEMGKGEVAVPVLIDRLRDQRSYIRNTACRQIQEIGPEAKAAVPTLIELLSDEDEMTRRKAAAALAMMRTEARAAAPTLRRLRDAEPVQSHEFPVQSHEFFDWALEQVGIVNEAEVPALIEALKEEESRLRNAQL